MGQSLARAEQHEESFRHDELDDERDTTTAFTGIGCTTAHPNFHDAWSCNSTLRTKCLLNGILQSLHHVSGQYKSGPQD